MDPLYVPRERGDFAKQDNLSRQRNPQGAAISHAVAAGADRGCLKDQPNTRSVWVSHQANHSLFLKIGLRDPVLANSRENFLDQSPKAARCSQYMSGLRKDESEVKSCASGDIIGAD